MPRDEKLLKNAVTMTSSAQRSGDQLQVEVSIVNDKTGHDVPTDAPMRSLILVVEAIDADGKALALSDGPVNPDYSGEYAGLSRARPSPKFCATISPAKCPPRLSGAPSRLLQTRASSRWRPIPLSTASLHRAEAVTIHVRLLYRRAFSELAQQKGWNDPDILMADETLQIAAN